jgi:hypothetical protein
MTEVLIPDDAIVSWTQPAEELWIASAEGHVVGRIELHEDRYVAIDGRGYPIGVNGDLETAKVRFDQGGLLAAPVTVLTRVRAGLRRTLRRPTAA